jgi:Flp pilus assembly protein TadB
MSDELSELQENAEHGRENPSLAPISVTMAILAVCVAVVSLMGHRSHTEELLTQNRATDQWSYYQAKNIRRHNYEMSLDLLALIEFKDKTQAEKVRAKYQGEAERYTKEQAEIEEQAKEFEAESARAQRKADRFDLGEVFLEIALVITSLALLTKNRLYWLLGLAGGVGGLAIAVSGHLLH